MLQKIPITSKSGSYKSGAELNLLQKLTGCRYLSTPGVELEGSKNLHF